MGDSHDIMMSKRSQTLKSAPCMTLFIENSSTESYGDGNQNRASSGGWWDLLIENGVQVTLLIVGNVVYLDLVYLYTGI